jgi:type IV pilus assembly PilN-like protein
MSQQINLFNPIFLKQKKHFSARTMLQGLLLIIGAVAAVYVLQVYQLSALRTQERGMRLQADQVTQRLASAGGDPRAAGAKALEDEIRSAESELKTLQELAGALQTEARSGNEGFSRYLAAFARQPVSGLWLTGFTVVGDDLELRGRALKAELLPVFIRRLSREDVLRGKAFSEVSVTAQAAAQKAGPAQQAGASQVPQRYVEFSLATRDKGSARP